MMQDWFRNAKLGIFIHYGIYAVGDVSESWSFHNGNISYEDYMKQCEGFTASKFDAKKWAELFQKAGAQYVVMTAKHHDGVALFDTGYSDLSVVKKTPAARDLVKEYTAAMREAGLKRRSLLFTDRLVGSAVSHGLPGRNEKRRLFERYLWFPGRKRGGAGEMAGVSGIQQPSAKRTDVELRNGGPFMV